MSFKLDILAEFPDFLFVNKPPDLLIHPTRPGGPVTLWDHLRNVLAFEIANGGQVSIITRLDRDTSGVVLVAKSHDAASQLHRMIEAHQIQKEYLALVFGHPTWDTQSCTAPILREADVYPDFKIWVKQIVHPQGAPCHTDFTVLSRHDSPHGPLSLIHARPHSGRLHQIRVHLAHLGHPVVGDKLYGPDDQWYLRVMDTGWTSEMQQALLLPRHALHAHSLTFTLHNQTYQATAPLAPDMII